MNVLRMCARIVAVVLSLAAAAGCAKNKAGEEAPPKPLSHYFDIKVGEKTVRMQLAVLPAEQERGLMQRRDLGADDGMVFIYAKPQQMHFWMRNTPTPLDIGFFDGNGALLEVYPLQPFDERTVSSRSSAVQFALEMNQGWFSGNRVLPGAKLDLDALAKAMKARGFTPRAYGLE